MVKDLSIRVSARQEFFGFCISKISDNKLSFSNYTKDLLNQTNFKSSNDNYLIVGAHSFTGILIYYFYLHIHCMYNTIFLGWTVIHTDYFNFLDKTFGFESTPNIHHAYCENKINSMLSITLIIFFSI